MNGVRLRDTVIVLIFQLRVGALRLAAVELGDFLQPRERRFEFLLRRLLVVPRLDDALLEQVALVNADFFIGRVTKRCCSRSG
jgi:hypothetical protein